MHDAGFVRGGERTCSLNRDVDCGSQRRLFTRQIFAQRLAVNKLGGDEVCAIRFANLENSEDVGLVEGGRSASFLFKTAHAFSLASDLGGQQFERDFTVQTCVFGQVN